MRAVKHIFRCALAVLLSILLITSTLGVTAFAEGSTAEGTAGTESSPEVGTSADPETDSANPEAEEGENLPDASGESKPAEGVTDSDIPDAGEGESESVSGAEDEIPGTETGLVGAGSGYRTYQDYMNLINEQFCTLHGDGDESAPDPVRFSGIHFDDNEHFLVCEGNPPHKAFADNEHFLVCEGNPPHKAFAEPHQFDEFGYCEVCNYNTSSFQRSASDWNELCQALPHGTTYIPVIIDIDADIVSGDTSDYPPLVIPEYTTVTLNLNGHSIDRNHSNTDASEDGGVITNYGELVINNGTITGGNKSGNGGGIYCGSSAVLILNDVTVTGNNATGNGGAIRMEQKAFVTLNNTTITGNSAYSGSGVHMAGDNGKLTMNGGCISDNTATYGPGVNMTSTSSFTVYGAPVISGNTAERGDNKGDYNVYLKNNTIRVGGTLTDGADIHVTVYTKGDTASDPIPVTSGLSGKGSVDCFHSDRPSAKITEQNNEAYWTPLVKHAITISVNDEALGSVTASTAEAENVTEAYEEDTVTLTAAPGEGYALSAISVARSDGTTVPVEDNIFVMPSGDVTVTAVFKKELHYAGADGSDHTCAEYTLLDEISGNTLDAEWYAVTNNIDISSRLVVSGKVNLILCDGVTLTLPKGITVNKGDSLTIWGQEGGTGTLTITNPDISDAGIGGSDSAGGTITINGGTLDVRGGARAAGIGGGYQSGKRSGRVTINGGSVTARGGASFTTASGGSTGIGGGYNAYGDVVITGGTVNAVGSYSAPAIGQGHFDVGNYPDKRSSVTISGGTVVATNSGLTNSKGYAVLGGDNSDVTISGGNVTATSTLEEGIGIGGSSSRINISGGTITASGNPNGGHDIYGSGGTTLSGNPDITGEIYVQYLELTIGGELSNTKPVTVRKDKPGVFTSGLAGNGSASNFRSASEDYIVSCNEAGEAMLVALAHVTYDANGGQGTVEDTTGYVPGDTCTVLGGDALTHTGKHMSFYAWNTRADGTGDEYAPGDEFTITGNTTLYAQFAHVHDDITFLPWYRTDIMPTAPGSYYLTQNMTLTEIMKPTGTVNLCLNGKSVDGYESVDYDIIYLGSGETLSLYDCADDPGVIFGASNGVCIDNGTFNMYGGVITECSGDGVVLRAGTFNMHGGKIRNCNRAGVWIGHGYNEGQGYSTFTMTGGEITECLWYGVLLEDSSFGTFNVSGSPVILGNLQTFYDDEPYDVSLLDPTQGYVINVIGPLTEDARIGVAISFNPTSPFTKGLKGNGDASNFISNHEDGDVVLTPEGEARLAGRCTVTFDSDGGSAVDAQIVHGGEKAVRPEDPTKDGFVFKGWYQVTDAGAGTLADTAFDFENTVINGNVTLKAVWEEKVEEPVIIKSANVEFSGKIQLQFALVFPDSLLADEGTYVTFEKAGTITKMPVSEGTAEGDAVSFVIPVPAPEYADDVVVRVFDGGDNRLPLKSAGGTDYTENGFAYSVKTYAQNKSQTGSTEEFRALAKALNDYGTAAQIYFQYGDTSGLTVDGAVSAVTPDDLAPYALTTEGTKPDGVTGAGIMVEFDTYNTLRITFKTDGSKPIGDYTFMLDGKKKTPTKKGKNAYLQVKNIAAPNLDTPHTFTVTDGTKTYTVTASALSYAYTSVKNGDSARQDLGRALYLYNQAANAHFGS